MDQSGALKWREVVEKNHAAMLDELSAQFHSDLQDALAQELASALASERAGFRRQLAQACDDARRSRAEQLNQALRRQRHAAGREQVLQFLLESCAPLVDKAVVLLFENNQARAIVMKGLPGGAEPAFAIPVFPISDAKAVVSAIESLDPVVALGSPEEISAVLANAFRSEAGPADDYAKAYLFPLVARQNVVGVLIASGDVDQAPVELLCEAAAMRIEGLQHEVALQRVSAPGPDVTRRPSNGINSWHDLPLEEQTIHLQAQRMARVRVAEMRLDQEDALRTGTAVSDIYGALQTPIDTARRQFLQTFIARSPTMVDYLHLEILRTLANDDDRLLGTSYPGPMV